MRLRITRETPPRLNGFDTSSFRPSQSYEVGAALGETLVAYGFALPEEVPTPPTSIKEIADTLRANEGRRVRLTYDDDVVQVVEIWGVDDEGFLHSGPNGSDPRDYWTRFDSIKRIETVSGE